MAASVLRILIGWLVPAAPDWFRAWIPGFFHMVLAGFVMTMALSAPQRLPHSNELSRMDSLNQILPYLWYPATMALAIVSVASMLAIGEPTAVASYLPVFLAGVLILFLERRFPENTHWRPRSDDLAADVAFLAVTQIALPRALVLLTVVALTSWAHERAPVPVWPHQWPLASQILLMLLIVDFVRYWLHRACHHYLKLWRLHEVHHSPELLYVLNVGRFHPLEQALHFLVDTLPFMLVGAGPDVMGGYFVVYSINGLFQHCNIRIRYGCLNYLVGSAETHRWHHARDPRTAACNFGNTTIVWDLLFGTYYLPPRQTIETIGIPDRNYPRGFLRQMAAPFR
jgi:ornithine lipid hydroxylase